MPPGAEAAGVWTSPHPASLAADRAASGMGLGPPTRVSRKNATKVTAPRPPIHAARLMARRRRIRRRAVSLAPPPGGEVAFASSWPSDRCLGLGGVAEIGLGPERRDAIARSEPERRSERDARAGLYVVPGHEGHGGPSREGPLASLIRIVVGGHDDLRAVGRIPIEVLDLGQLLARDIRRIPDDGRAVLQRVDHLVDGRRGGVDATAPRNGVVRSGCRRHRWISGKGRHRRRAALDPDVYSVGGFRLVRTDVAHVRAPRGLGRLGGGRQQLLGVLNLRPGAEHVIRRRGGHQQDRDGHRDPPGAPGAGHPPLDLQALPPGLLLPLGLGLPLVRGALRAPGPSSRHVSSSLVPMRDPMLDQDPSGYREVGEAPLRVFPRPLYASAVLPQWTPRSPPGPVRRRRTWRRRWPRQRGWTGTSRSRNVDRAYAPRSSRDSRPG